MRDFTCDRLRLLLKALVAVGYRPVTLRSFLESTVSHEKRVIIRHDVDRNPENALKIASMEDSLGICASYYFRYPYTFDPAIIRLISGEGHEIGYHYEVLAKTRGNVDEALSLFKSELCEFRKICDVVTCCAHGSPLSRFDNRELFCGSTFSGFGIIGDAHLSVPQDIPYFSDTGRSWGMQENIRDRLISSHPISAMRSTDELQEHILTADYDNLYLVIHPERWNDPGFQWAHQLCRDIAFNTGKCVLHWVRLYGSVRV